MNMKIYTITDEYGFWCPAGRNLFFMIPKLSFIDIKDEPELATDYFLIDEPKDENILSDHVFVEMMKISKRKLYIPISEKNQSKITTFISKLVIGDLPTYLHFHGRFVTGKSMTCPTVELIDEITIGVDNPELHRDMLLKTLQSEPSLSTYSPIRPLDSYDDYEEILDRSLIQSQFKLPINSIHGISHWKQVEAIGHRLSASTKADKVVVSYFAYLHDSKRQNEDEDLGHGETASIYCEQLYKQGILKITENQLSQLLYACKFHSDSKAKTDDMTIATCWDADRLDLNRIGITPDSDFLYTNKGKSTAFELGKNK